MLGLCLLLLWPRWVQADETELSQLVAKVESFYRNVSSFSARFEQKLERSHLPDHPLKKSGKVYFKKPGKMRWDYSRPEKVHYVSDGEFLWNYIPESQLVYQFRVQESELFYALRFLVGEGNLANDFIVSDGGREGAHRVLVLRPKGAHQSFQELKLFVDPTDGHIDATMLTDPAGNISHLTFLKVSYKPLPDKGFRFTPPSGVDIIKPGQE